MKMGIEIKGERSSAKAVDILQYVKIVGIESDKKYCLRSTVFGRREELSYHFVVVGTRGMSQVSEIAISFE